MARHVERLKIVGFLEKFKELGEVHFGNLIVDFSPFLHICCCIIRRRIVAGAAKPIASNMEDEVCRRLRCVGFFIFRF